MIKSSPLLAATLCISLLSACGESQPTDADLQAAMQKNIEAVAGKDDMFKDELAKMKILACKKAEPQGFNCDIEGMMGITQSVRMIKTDDGWRMIQGGINGR